MTNPQPQGIQVSCNHRKYHLLGQWLQPVFTPPLYTTPSISQAPPLTKPPSWGFSPFEGDGNGFKLGGGDAADIGPANHNITNSIAFLNAAGGFVDNSQTGNFILTRNTAWNNGGVGFKFSSAIATLKSNIAALNAGGQTSLSSSQVQSGNSWNVGGTWNNATFKSVSSSSVTGARASTGKIVGSDFLLPTSGAAIGATTYW
jgi:hypothetical protein